MYHPRAWIQLNPHHPPPLVDLHPTPVSSRPVRHPLPQPLSGWCSPVPLVVPSVLRVGSPGAAMGDRSKPPVSLLRSSPSRPRPTAGVASLIYQLVARSTPSAAGSDGPTPPPSTESTSTPCASSLNLDVGPCRLLPRCPWQLQWSG